LILDTDILIWYLRGNEKARQFVETSVPFSLSVVTYMELVQGMKDKAEFKLFQKQFKKWNVDIIQIDKEISSRAMFYVKEYSLSVAPWARAMMLADALIAATAVQNSETLFTANVKQYKFIPNIDCRKFNPGS